MRTRLSIVVVMSVLALLSVPMRFADSDAVTGSGSAVSITIESRGFNEARVEKHVADDDGLAAFSYDQGWSVSYVAALAIAGLACGALMMHAWISTKRRAARRSE